MLTMKIVEWKDDHYLWTAEVTTPQGIWRTPQPMHPRELNQMLLSMGVDKDEIFNARTKAFVEDAESTYRRIEKEYLPFLQAALAEEGEVPPPRRPYIEAWMAYTLYYHDEIRPLWKVLNTADCVYWTCPTRDELSWAFLRLRKRGWLIVDGEKFGMTLEGRRVIQDVLSRDDDMYWYVRIEKWMSYHPLPGEDRMENWRNETKVFSDNAESEYRRIEKEYLPFLQAALAGEGEVPQRRRRISEVWFAYALYRRDGLRPLREILSSADDLFVRIPNYDELSWAFLRLRRRGWLLVDGDMFDLTPEGRRIIQELNSRDDNLRWNEKLERWMSEHPLPGDE